MEDIDFDLNVKTKSDDIVVEPYTTKDITSQMKLKHQILAEDFAKKFENGEPIVKSKLLQENGFAPGSLSVFETKSFQKVLDEILPDELIVSAHRELVSAKNVIEKDFPAELGDSEIEKVCESMGKIISQVELKADRYHGEIKRCWIEVQDRVASEKAVDMAYKLKGAYAPEKHMVAVDTDLSSMSDEELDAFLADREKMAARYNSFDVSPADYEVVNNSENVEKHSDLTYGE